MPVFVDTNVLVYARDESDPAKHATAGEWMEYLWTSGEGRLSTQVLHEYYVTVTRKLSPGLDKEEARSEVLDLTTWEPVLPDDQMIGSAWSIEDASGISFWDALIVAAAAAAGCERLLTEDLQHGAVIHGVQIADPFRTPAGPAE